MNENNPIEDLLHQINDLLQIVADKSDKPLSEEIPRDIDSKLTRLEKQMEVFRKATKAEMAQLGISDEEMENLIQRNVRLSSVQTEILNRTEKLKAEVEEKKKFLESLPQPEAQAPLDDFSMSEKKASSSRKSLFKRIGGNKNWRPL